MTARPAGARFDLAAGCALAGIALRLVRYALRGPLWLDEAMLAQNITFRSLGDLLGRALSYRQVAPPGFLGVERLAVVAFGPHEWTLRLVPLLGALASVPLFLALARRMLTPAAVAPAMALFSVDRGLLTWSTELKPYSTDVATAIGLTLAVVIVRERGLPRRGLVAVALLGAAAVWWSQSAGLVLAGLALASALVDAKARRWDAIARMAVVWVVWAISAACAVVFAFRHLDPAVGAYLHSFWTVGFWPPGLRHVLWPAGALVRALVALHRTWVAGFAIVLVAIGAWMMWRRRSAARRCAARSTGRFASGGPNPTTPPGPPSSRESLALLVGPVFVTLAAATAREYPFADRLVLFLLPAALLLVGEALGGLLERRRRLGIALSLLIVVPQSAVALERWRHEDLKTIAARVADRRSAADDVYVFYWAEPAFSYYSRLGPSVGSFTRGGCHRPDWRGYLRELDAYRGRPRVWVVLGHADNENGVRADSLFARYLARIARPLERYTADSSSATLYDFLDAPSGTTPDSIVTVPAKETRGPYRSLCPP